MSVIDYEALFQDDGVHVDPQEMATAVRTLLNATSSVAANSLIVKQTSGLVFGFTASSSLGAGQFIQLHDASSLPSDGAVPVAVFAIGSTSTAAAAWIPPRSFRNGIVICNSTTQNTKTLGAANTLFDVQYL